jgi:hypothetical protein
MLRLAYGTLLIAVEGPEAPLAWLREFLGAAFSDAPPGAPPRARVRVSIAPVTFENPDGEIEMFSLDGSFVHLPVRRDGRMLLACDGDSVLHRIEGNDTSILAPEDGPALRLALLRVVREIATAHALAQGWLHLHAAAVETEGTIVAFAGPRESGKTTLLLHALLEGDTRYLTNDRVLLDLAPDPPFARGMPTIVSLRDETLARFPEVARRLATSGYARWRTLAEARRATDWRSRLTPAQLRALAGAAEIPGGPLAAIVFPSITPAVATFDMRPVPRDLAPSRLRTALFLSTVPERPAEAFALRTQPRDEAALTRLCAGLAARVPCLDVRLGKRAYEDPSVWAALRERLR